ncbi:MAG: hypothetical protein PVH81_02970 [Syntrophobacterales bacterium]|jgi:hypothetical protein
MEVGNRSVKLKLEPGSYPVIKIDLNGQDENNTLETEVKFPREFWLNMANSCKEVAGSMGAFTSQTIVSGLNLMHQSILLEIAAEDKRLKYQKAYESLVDFVFEINNRTDLDKVRKGQLIHDRACELKLQP